MATPEATLEDGKRPQFGTRHLTDAQNVFQHNAWDNVVWDETQEEEARIKTQQQFADALPTTQQDIYEEKASDFWDAFYNIHTNRFFKDRHWLFVEFPELYTNKNSEESSASNIDNCAHATIDKDSVQSAKEDILGVTSEKSSKTESIKMVESYPGENSNFKILEVGCGVGNTIFPVLQTNNDPRLMIYGCDFSSAAIQIVKEHADYNPKQCHAFVCDVSDDSTAMPMPDESLDIIILIFVLSAINPEKMQAVITRLAKLLKPGGHILFRDYGRYDLAQLRFKKGRCLSENFYVRGDGTRVYFFTQDELRDMFVTAGLEERQNLIDRRLQVNRGKQLKMYRIWIQCKYQKPICRIDADSIVASGVHADSNVTSGVAVEDDGCQKFTTKES